MRTKSNEITEFEDYAELTVFNIKEESFKYMIDLEDVPKIKNHKWYKNGDDYLIARIDKEYVTLHKFIMGECYTEIYKNIDHDNRNKFDNRKSNLRISTNSENSFNKSIYKNNTSEIIGVGFDKFHKKYIATLSNGTKQYKKFFYKKDEAIICRLNWEMENFKQFAPQRHLFEVYGIFDKDFVSLDNMKIECDKILENINNEYNNRKYLELSKGYFVVENKYKGLKDYI